MTLPRPNSRALVVAALVFAAVLGALTLLNRPGDDAPPGSSPAATGVSAVGPRAGSAQDRVRTLEATIATGKATPRAYTELGEALVQLNRDANDPTALPRAERAFDTALERNPRDVRAITGQASVAASNHQFADALTLTHRARRIDPDSLAPYPVMIDALIELGRYGDAERTLQQMADLKPGLPAYSRVSYYRELHGDLAGAQDALELAVSSGGSAPENVAYVQSLLGGVEFLRGRIGAAEESYRAALDAVPSYAPAAEGLARVEAARGNLSSAIDLLRDAIDQKPLVEYQIAIGEAELAAGRPADARRDLAAARRTHLGEQAAGVDVAVERAVFEADHGSPREAVAQGRQAWQRTPSVRAADALGWALTRAGRPDEGLEWARRSLRIGSRYPSFLYHAGIAARDAGQTREARRYLRAALGVNPHFSPLHAPRAKRALEAID